MRERLSLTSNGRVLLKFKKPLRDGSSQSVFSTSDLIICGSSSGIATRTTYCRPDEGCGSARWSAHKPHNDTSESVHSLAKEKLPRPADEKR
jgi:hypothetical protein